MVVYENSHMLQKYQNHIEKFGLSANEVKVYIGLIQHGAGTANEIAIHAGLKRSTAYVQLTSLIASGLVSTYKLKKKTFFAAESPRNLERLLDKKISAIEVQKKNIEELISDLAQVFVKKDTRPIVRVFEGSEGLLTMHNELLCSGVQEYYAACSLDEIYSIFSGDELSSFTKKRTETGIFEYLLYNKSGRTAPKEALQESKRVSAETFPFNTNIYVYGDVVSFTSTSGKIFGLTITNENIARSIRSLFVLAWQTK